MLLLWKLLRQHISLAQLCGFMVANLIGAFIVLFGLQVYQDMSGMLMAPDSYMKDSYVVISKPVSGLSTVGSLLGMNNGFSSKEIDDLKQVKGVASVGAFTASDFEVYGAVEMGGPRIATEMFLESVPDSFLDLSPSDWTSKVENDFVPIIMPRNYLNLYNYGFATSHGLPQLSEGMMGNFPFRLHLTGNNHDKWYNARIVGFSNRLNTILVPDDFMKQANEYYGSGKTIRPTRLIIAADTKHGEVLTNYLEKHHYSDEANASDNLRTLGFIRAVASVVVALGLLVSVLSCYVLFISILLLIQKNRETISTLIGIGYTARAVSTPYCLLTLALDVVVWLGAGIIVAVVRCNYLPFVETMSPGYTVGAPWALLVGCLALMLGFAAFHMLVVRRKINGI